MDIKDIELERRTLQQNSALHLYFELVAEALNDAGYDVKRAVEIDISWTKESVKELLWKHIQKTMYGKLSTTELNKVQEIDRIYDNLNRFLAKLGIENVPFPSNEEEK